MAPAPTSFARYLPHAFVIGVFTLYCIAATFWRDILLADADVGWHFAAGEAILQMGRIPDRDLWSFTAGDTVWYNISWMFDVMVGWAYRQLGLANLCLLFVMLGGIITGGLAWLCLKRHCKLFDTGLLMAVLIVSLPAMFIVRPQVITYLMLLVFYIVLRVKPRMLWLLPLLMLLWVNMHGGFLAGYTLLGAFLLEAIFHRDERFVLSLILTGFTCLAVTLLNPLGVDIVHAALLSLWTNNPVAAIILEWKPVSPQNNIPFLLYCFLFLISFRPFNPAIPLADKILGVFWMGMALHSVRHVPIFLILSVSTIAYGLGQSPPTIPWLKRLIARGEAWQQRMSEDRAKKMALILCMLVLAVIITPQSRHFIKGDDFHFPYDIFPAKETAYIESHYPNQRIFNDYDFGGYFIFINRGRNPLYIDGRAVTVYPEQISVEFLRFFDNADDWPTILDEGRLNLALIRNHSVQMERLLDSGKWKTAYTGDAAVVMVRKKPIRNP